MDDDEPFFRAWKEDRASFVSSSISVFSLLTQKTEKKDDNDGKTPKSKMDEKPHKDKIEKF